MEPEKEKWINDVLRSLNGLQRAEPNPFLFAKIRNRLSTAQLPVYVSARAVWLTVASFALLLFLNWRVIYQPSNTSPSQTTDLTTVVIDMYLFPNDNQLY